MAEYQVEMLKLRGRLLVATRIPEPWKLGKVWNRVGYIPAKGFRMRIISDRTVL